MTGVPQNDAAEGPEDRVLVERIRRGDDAAFTALYRRYARQVAGLAYRMLGRDERGEIDDIVQETFCAASNKIATIRDPDRVRSWLLAVAVRRVHHLLRKKQSHRARLRQWFEQRRAPARDAAAAHALYDILDRLPPRLRIPWVLHRVEEETLPDVAKTCGASLATIKRRIAEAQQRIERRLDRE